MKPRRKLPKDHEKSANPANGLWRDRNYLVIDLREHTFTSRCLISNRPVEMSAEPVTLWTQSVATLEIDRLEDDEQLTDAGVVRITQGHKSPTTVEVRLRLPLRPSW